MCDPRNHCPGPDCAHDRGDDTWLTPTDLRPVFREPTPPETTTMPPTRGDGGEGR